MPDTQPIRFVVARARPPAALPMDKLRIRGGMPLRGEITVAGAKNAALPILAASLLTADELVLTNVPELADIATMVRLLRGMGIAIERCVRRCWFWAPCSRGSARRACRCPVGARSARGPWIST
jgi:hypothetical protein